MAGRVHASSKIRVLDTDTMTWSKPNVAGVAPLPRYRHATAMVGSQMFMFGGFGGGADLYALDTGIVDEAKADLAATRRRRRGRGAGEAREDSGNELISWLEGLGLGKYTRVFVRQEVDFDTLVELSPEDLREMGIVALGPSHVTRALCLAACCLLLACCLLPLLAAAACCRFLPLAAACCRLLPLAAACCCLLLLAADCCCLLLIAAAARCLLPAA